jgi:hypothetical protein
MVLVDLQGYFVHLYLYGVNFLFLKLRVYSQIYFDLLSTKVYYKFYQNFFLGNLYTHWLGPYEVHIVYDNDSIKLCTIDDDKTVLMANVH